ncbi:MAG: CopG family transcriptional regulator [bacterium (Candidatus Stahlbacteria) CG23_combo_of_CG06-09_8_20_14_all_34_7]|nr:MAG: CopG family transcriptional regulator [bacterium (Candidatus Stahlbacteria) CG23_combo_of_CG06-09_8_20_14_all_34_7]
MDKRIGVVGIIVEDRSDTAREVNQILTDFGYIVRGRMGIPNLSKNICAIALIVEGTNEDIGAMTGKLGRLKKVKVSSTFIKKELK